jgi:DUF1365 family protein
MNATTPDNVPSSGLYRGTVMHHRLAPKRNLFTYPVFVFVLDLDELPALDRRLRLFRHNRFSLYSLRDGDYFPGHDGGPGGRGDRPVKEKVIALLRERGYAEPIDRVMMITQPRVLGHVFNPVTFYYCYRDGREVAHVAEITNTFRQRHSYAFFGGVPDENTGGQEKGVAYLAEKVFYVSPFLDMDLSYSFRFAPLGASLAVHVDDFEAGKPVLKTWIRGTHAPLSDRALLAAFLRLPFMSAWILAWIHWQALKLWLRGIPLVFRPADGMKPGGAS